MAKRKPTLIERLTKKKAEVSITTQVDSSMGYIHRINYDEGYLELHPIVINDPESDKPYISRKSKYISLYLLSNSPYSVLEFDEGHIEKLVKAKGKRPNIGFPNERVDAVSKR